MALGQVARRAGRRTTAAEAFSTAASRSTNSAYRDGPNEPRRSRPRRPVPVHDHTLTEIEHRVAELVASGRSNQGVAAELFLSVKTVEANLTRIYRKLSVRTRTELANHLRG
ncbi:helix-turn-helix transcriptional regulator [Kribbella sp. NBC_00709]|uniref:response regulator transcription factor n=1 Tax=Kribbella sp. NBC_00709 TaxID=2975972 RepID=UPI002E2E6F19|nr:helix-turn-helix transcriptional regulator [Kribbella sp. NBC_00709]